MIFGGRLRRHEVLRERDDVRLDVRRAEELRGDRRVDGERDVLRVVVRHLAAQHGEPLDHGAAERRRRIAAEPAERREARSPQVHLEHVRRRRRARRIRGFRGRRPLAPRRVGRDRFRRARAAAFLEDELFAGVAVRPRAEPLLGVGRLALDDVVLGGVGGLVFDAEELLERPLDRAASGSCLRRRRRGGGFEERAVFFERVRRRHGLLLFRGRRRRRRRHPHASPRRRGSSQ
mmetsp:Transcript_8904/g.36780  ORF Transcript_8904/g.36780 Transcript_8904/m.36780 type:complete len:233 (+) Transcript_8904:816-1514(+)